MNIRDAARQLEGAVRAYAARTEDGARRVPLAAQRPIFLMGPPGVGKTAMVAQVAAKLGIGYAAYTMTHHTRQSALGLPMIVHRALGGEDRAVTEYTMSEIVADVWTKAEAGAETGILFLDEINCVSESLMPAMLQLLQYKTFGVHALPEGWMIVCAGNPPRYNRYARTFDAVVMDRLRLIDVEPDFDAWRAYAAAHGVHPVIRSYLALRPGDFYLSDGDRIVTARSWTDLSDVMLAMDSPDEGLFGQYLQIPEAAERFSLYYKLCADLGSRLDEVLEGGGRLPNGLPFDEAVFAALFVSARLEGMIDDAASARRMADSLSYFVDGVARGTGGVEDVCWEQLSRRERALSARRAAGLTDTDAEEALNRRLKRLVSDIHGLGDAEAMDALRNRADEQLAAAKAQEDAAADALGRGLDFIDDAALDPALRLIFLNDLKHHPAARRLIDARHRNRFDALWQSVAPEAH